MILSTGENIIQKKRKVSTKFQFLAKLNSKNFSKMNYTYKNIPASFVFLNNFVTFESEYLLRTLHLHILILRNCCHVLYSTLYITVIRNLFNYIACQSTQASFFLTFLFRNRIIA
jgi:hypothetical protein